MFEILVFSAGDAGLPGACSMTETRSWTMTGGRRGAHTCAGSDLAPSLAFDPSGALVRSFGAGMILWPHGLHVDPDGNVWVTDARGEGGKGHQVFQFSPDGRLLMNVGTAGR